MSNYKFLAGLILGAAAGTAITLFLQTEKGKEIMDDVKSVASDAGDTLKAKIKGLNEELSDLLQKGKRFLDDLERKADEATT